MIDQTFYRDLIRQDLNLLILFATLVETRSVTQAAQRLALSQPAVSHALARLRLLLQDELFLRNKQGFILTPRAEALVVPVQQVLVQINQLLQAEHFDPSTVQRVFRLAVSDYNAAIMLPSLLKVLRRDASGVSLSLQDMNNDVLLQLEQGTLDLGFWGMSTPPEPFCHKVLFQERLVGVMHRQHVLAQAVQQGPMSLQTYLSCTHIEVKFIAENNSLVDQVLREMKQQRRIMTHGPSFAICLASLVGTDLLMSLPERLALAFAQRFDLLLFELPFEVPEYAYSIVWHQRTDKDPGARWLRDLIVGLADEMPASEHAVGVS